MIARIARITENSKEAECPGGLLMLLNKPPVVNLFDKNLVCIQ